MTKLYCIDTQNKLNQKLLFTSLSQAIKHLKITTYLNDKQINDKIKVIEKTKDKYFNIFN